MDYSNELEHFSLRWNNFNDNMKTGFHELLRREDFVDVTIAAEGKLIQAHKMVLSICSPYFKNIFKTNPCQHPVVFLKDVTHKELAGILQFMYLGEVSVQQEELGRFLKTAEALQIKGLTGEEGGNKTPDSAFPLRDIKQYQNRKKTKFVHSDSVPIKRLKSISPVNDLNKKNAQISTTDPYSQTNLNVQNYDAETYLNADASELELLDPKTEPIDLENEVLSVKDESVNKSDSVLQLTDSTSDVCDEFNSSPNTPMTSGLNHDIFSGLGNDSYSPADGNQGLRYFPILTKNQGLCPICGRILQHKKNLQTHIADQHSGIFRCWPCQICHKVCKTWSALRVHTNRHHTKLDNPPLVDFTH